jgi:hypothetical protein
MVGNSTSKFLHATNAATGEYQDRRSKETIDCANTIWVLATNALDPEIQDFSTANYDTLFVNEDMSAKMKLMNSFSKELKPHCVSKFGVSLICS